MVAFALGLGGEAKSSVAVAVGDRVKVTESLKVYHVPKVKELDLLGAEGVVKDVLGTWKGIPVSANLPYKVQFILPRGDTTVKFIAHLQDGEFEIIAPES